ncbi:MAG: C-terminal binding protein [Dehalococcoidia bacterium]|nr:C-terminal binding protein [Dehalococcoidia bacterium]
MSTDTPFTAVQTESNDPAWFEVERAIVEPAGGRVLVQRAATQEERAELLRDAQCVLVGGAKIDGPLLDQLPKLELIIRYGVGLDSLDIPAATEHGVVVAHYPDFCQPEVANHALMLLLAVARKLIPHDRAVRSGAYRGVPLQISPALTHETLGIVALGNIGRQMAKRAQALDMNVLAYDPYVDDATFEALGVRRAPTLEALLAESDHISIHAPLTPETNRMFGAEQFRQMKPTAILVNTARGPIVQLDALVEALQAGEIAGVGLDVFEIEPIGPEHPLYALDNVALTPHSAFYSEYSNRHIKERIGQTIVEFMNGKWPTVATLPNRAEVHPKRALS